MKKSRQIVLGLMLIFVMALASGCGDGRNNTKSTESTRQSQSAISAESTEGGMANGPTNGTDARESTGVLDGLADDIKDGAEDIKNGVEHAVDDGTVSSTMESSVGDYTTEKAADSLVGKDEFPAGLFFRLMPVSCARSMQVIVWWRRIMKSWRSKCFTVVKTES